MKQLLIVLSWFAFLPIAAQKQKDIEYIARRNATIAAMDSLLKNAQVQRDILVKFADQKCKEFHKDPVLMSAIATSFAIYAGHEDIAVSRFQELIKSNPKNEQCYIDYANLLYSLALKQGTASIEADYVKRAKLQIDSAKVVAPKSLKPYQAWVGFRAPYVHISGVEEDVAQEIEAWNKRHPDSQAYLMAARIFMDADISKINNEDLKKGADQQRIINMAVGYFEKAGVENMRRTEILDLARQYYQSSIYTTDKVPVFEKGAAMACKGLSLSSEMSERERIITFGKYVLWNGAQIASRDTTDLGRVWADSAAVMADAYCRYPSDMGWQDCFYSALAYQEKERYEESIAMYRKALASAGIVDNNQYFRIGAFPAMENIISCYQRLRDYASVIDERKKMISRKQEKSVLSHRDLRNLVLDYNRIVRDDKSNAQDSILAYQGIDATCQVIIDSIESGKYADMSDPSQYYWLQMNAHKRLDKLMPGQHDSQLTRNCADRVIRRLEKVSGRSEAENSRLADAYSVWANYYIGLKDMRKWAAYAQSILDVYPDYLSSETARENWRKAIKQYGGRRR